MKNNELSDKLWEEFVSGNANAFQQFYITYFEELYSYSFKIFPNQDFAKDCVQDVFVSLYERRAFLSKPQNLRNYLYQSVRNGAYRKLERENKYKDLKVDKSEHIVENETFNEEIYDRKKEVLSILIRNLSKKQQEILFLRFSRGFDYEEIGDLLGIDKSSVRKQVYRAIKKIRNSQDFSKSIDVILMLIPSFY
ncbi:RNA polymerase sigma factor [Algibacter miyuki]|uniref:RNA polymerase sigma factor n=1 Tax=Algibacter miyuki TaxID=1306933 RepID=A0ABV5H336_9FLAO|nr:sigma-70 family RNA polymerase sigma factor [Algibacter miyuki]MDN3665361.1 sigma-70 family RNA polymerase sigma factor [Algibacter miyuki]MDN3667643.1 sigma-70 family RNA polymerase sigma factor [Algibacter miyuki]